MNGINIYDMNNKGSFQCVAIAKSEKEKERLQERAYHVLFSPEDDNINCWVLCRVQSEVHP